MIQALDKSHSQPRFIENCFRYCRKEIRRVLTNQRICSSLLNAQRSAIMAIRSVVPPSGVR
jgi:hypothetical protein